MHHGVARDHGRAAKVVPVLVVVDVHAPHVVRARPVAGVADLSWTQRYPPHSLSDGDPDADPAEIAEESDEGRRVDRSRMIGAGHPAPATAVVDPASVVERREAPAGIVDPGPAPGPHIGPMTVAIRRPAGGH